MKTTRPITIHRLVAVMVATSFVAGAYIWSSARFGVDVEIDYNVIAEEVLVHELLFAVGPVYRF